MAPPPTQTSTERPEAPVLDRQEARAILQSVYGVTGEVTDLPSHVDRNFRVATPKADTFVFKVAHSAQPVVLLDLENEAFKCLAERVPGVAPSLCPDLQGGLAPSVTLKSGSTHRVRLLTWVDGEPLARISERGPALLRSLGQLLGRACGALSRLPEPAPLPARRWDLSEASWTFELTPILIERLEQRAPSPSALDALQQFQLLFAAEVLPILSGLPQGVLHGDANDHNLIVREGDGDPRVAGVIDFGDVTWGPRVFDLAIACAYAIHGQEDPLQAIGQIVAAHNEHVPLSEQELAVFFPALGMRLVQSVVVSASDGAQHAADSYLRVSEAPAWETLVLLADIEPREAQRCLRRACGLSEPAVDARDLDAQQIRQVRERHLGPSLSTAYSEPLHLVRGRGAYLFDETGEAYLDAVNNVCHLGHAHPGPLQAAQRQAELLNTNTRYLHGELARLSERLSGLFPDPLSVCYFVNSGSEAGELALRLARAATGRKGVICVEGGYHGNTSAMIDISPYKHSGPGGSGPPDWVGVLPLPDPYRGLYPGPHGAEAYAEHFGAALETLEEAGHAPAALFSEALIGCGGQIVPPHGWLSAIYARARSAGALCVADEVQVGFGRVGSHWWAFEREGVVPDIVTLGKPMGNGHPIAAVVTTPAIARAFDPEMEYFNTFGGNPVSCAVANAVLTVIEEEGLRERAQRVGSWLARELRALAADNPAMGDVRGVGMYLGIEWVVPGDEPRPDPQAAESVVSQLKERGFLLSTEGPQHNVIKIKPPLAFDMDEAQLLCSALRRIVLSRDSTA
jgi:4-aminobutyrate aminotransferase-like enzyme/Ser/Thr protein kinase RdoA (MazF antagonist)